MALMSTLKVLVRHGLTKSNQMVPVRFSGHDHKIRIQPSSYMWNKFKDHLHFYILLGVVPLSLLSLYCHVFIGDAELTETPEGYTPHVWEYYKHPISRFIAKYIIHDPSYFHETLVSKLAEESEKIILNRIEKEIKQMMAVKADDKSWYYMPVNPGNNRKYFDNVTQLPLTNLGVEDSGNIEE